MLTSLASLKFCAFVLSGAAALCLALTGCTGEDAGPTPTPPPGAHVHGDHDHGDAGHDHGDAGHDHGNGDHDHGDAGHDHGDGDHDHGDAGHDHGASDHDHGDTGHDHGDGDHDHGDAGHDHGDGGHAHADGDGNTRTVAGDAFGGRALRLEIGGGLEPGSELHVAGAVVSGPATDVLRVWVGDATGVGSMKAKADVVKGRFHVHVEVPAELPAGSALWFEHVGVDGEVQTVSVPVADAGV